MEKGKKRIYSGFSYEVSAIPYKKKAKKVNAGKIKMNSYNVSLSSWESRQVKVKMEISKYAQNKKAEVYDTKLRWYSSDENVAKVDKEGNITAQAKSGKCKICARAHNGNCDWLWVKVTNYARPKEFNGIEKMQQDMVKMIQQHGSDLKDIAEFFEKNKANHPKESQVMLFRLDSGRNYVEVETVKGKVDYKGIEQLLYKTMESFPGVMDSCVTSSGVHFVLEGESGSYVELIFLFQKRENKENGIKESNNFFVTASRWTYHYSKPGM